MKEQPKFDLTFPSVDVTEMNRSSCYYKNPYRRYILFFLLVNLRTTETSKLTNILLIGSFQSPLIHGCLFFVCVFVSLVETALFACYRQVGDTDEHGR